MDVLILGCGFTGRRVAARFLARGARVTVTTRSPENDFGGATVITLPEVQKHLRKGLLVLHSLPPQASAGVVEILGDAPARVVYFSTTGVYGAAKTVDENTPPDWTDDRARPRLLEEELVTKGPWSSLILRPAAIYGPGRGAHESLRRGTYLAGGNFVSRIHVDDLAAHAEQALLARVTGAFPVADEHPATTREVAEFCSALLRIPLGENLMPRRVLGDRRVDGSAIRHVLGITLRYPTYREGIPASLA